MRAVVKKSGNSASVRIPVAVLRAAHIGAPPPGGSDLFFILHAPIRDPSFIPYSPMAMIAMSKEV